MAKIIIPTPLRKFAENQSTVEIEGGTVLEAVQNLTTKHEKLKQHLLNNDGDIRSFIRIFVGDDDILALDNEQTAIENNTIISIVPAIAGG